MIGDVLGVFERALVLEVCGDARGAEGVIADPGLDTACRAKQGTFITTVVLGIELY